MKKVVPVLIVVLAVIFGVYFSWSALGRTAVAAEPDLYLDDLTSYGMDTDSGNLVAMQTYMEAADYASAASFQAKMDGYLAEAQAEGWLQPDTIVVFPEYLGTWLVLANEKQELFEAETLEAAIQLMVVSNVPSFINAYNRALGEDKIRDALFRMKADTIAEIYADTFSALAEKYGVTIVAGSLILPDPTVEDRQLIPGAGALQNISLVFRPDGTLDPQLTRKVFPTGDEGAFISGAKPEQLAAYDTPAGKLAVLVCADSWYPASYAALVEDEPQIFVVPNFFTSDPGWDKIWEGYDPGPEPEDVDLDDIGRITEGEARLKYTLDGRMQETGATTGMHVFFRGSIWELTGYGHTIIFTEDRTIEASADARGAVVNYWLPSKTSS